MPPVRKTNRSTDQRMFNIFQARIKDGKPFIASSMFPATIEDIVCTIAVTHDRETADRVGCSLQTPLMTENYTYHGGDFLLVRAR